LWELGRDRGIVASEEEGSLFLLKEIKCEERIFFE